LQLKYSRKFELGANKEILNNFDTIKRREKPLCDFLTALITDQILCKDEDILGFIENKRDAVITQGIEILTHSTEEGLFRKNGNKKQLDTIKKMINEEIECVTMKVNMHNYDVYTIADAIKYAFATLPSPNLHDCCIDYNKEFENANFSLPVERVLEIINKLPQDRKDYYAGLIRLLYHITKTPEILMPIKNILLIFPEAVAVPFQLFKTLVEEYSLIFTH